MARAAGTVADGLIGSNNSPQTAAVVHIFTNATASKEVAKSCLVNTSTQSNPNNAQLVAATFHVPSNSKWATRFNSLRAHCGPGVKGVRAKHRAL